jgi:tetratricopeptide (TPR) repeat protein
MNCRLSLVSVTLVSLLGAAPALATNLNQQLNIQPHNATQGASRDVADELMVVGDQYLANGQTEQAVAAWVQAADIYWLLGDSQGAGKAFGSIGTTYAQQGRFREAEQAWVRRVGIAADQQDPVGQVLGLNNLGMLHFAEGQLLQAQNRFEEALTLARPTQNPRAIGVSLNNLGLVATRQGNLSAAISFLESAANYRLLAGDGVGEANTSNNLGDVYVALGRQGNAIGAYRVGLRLGAEAGDRATQLRALDGLLGIYLEREDFATMGTHLRQRLALTPLEGATADLQTANSLRWLGDFHYGQGNVEAAQRAYGQGLGVARRVGYKPLEGELANRLLLRR